MTTTSSPGSKSEFGYLACASHRCPCAQHDLRGWDPRGPAASVPVARDTAEAFNCGDRPKLIDYRRRVLVRISLARRIALRVMSIARPARRVPIGSSASVAPPA